MFLFVFFCFFFCLVLWLSWIFNVFGWNQLVTVVLTRWWMRSDLGVLPADNLSAGDGIYDPCEGPLLFFLAFGISSQLFLFLFIYIYTVYTSCVSCCLPAEQFRPWIMLSLVCSTQHWLIGSHCIIIPCKKRNNNHKNKKKGCSERKPVAGSSIHASTHTDFGGSLQTEKSSNSH